MKWESLTSTRGKRKKCPRDGQRLVSHPPWLIGPPRVRRMPHKKSNLLPLSSHRPVLTHRLPTERYFGFTISQLWLYEQHFQMSVGGVNMNHTHTSQSSYCHRSTHDNLAFVCLNLSAQQLGPCVSCHRAAVSADQCRALLMHAASDGNTCQILTAVASTHMTCAGAPSLTAWASATH